MRLSGALQSATDAVQLLAFDWISARRRPYWNAARKDLRTWRFRARARLPVTTLAQVAARLSREPAEVVLPSVLTEQAGVGDPAYYYILGALARACAPQTVLEFGTYLGVGTLTLALNTPPGARIVTIDLPEQVARGALAQLDATDQELVRRSRQRVGQAFAGHALAGKIQQVLADSLTLDAGAHVKTADLVLVDGGHSYPLIKKDTENALAVLASRGVVIWDDYWWLYPEVGRYLEALGQDLPLQRLEDTNFVVYLRGVP